MEEINHGNGGTCLIIGSKVGQLIVGTKGFAFMACTNTSGDVVFAADDIIADGVDGIDIGGVARKGCHVSHSCIHISGTDSMSPCFGLLDDRFVALGIDVVGGSLSTIAEQEFSLVEIAFVAGEQVEPRQCHLGNLMTGSDTDLVRTWSDFADDAVSIAASYVEKLIAACGLIVCAGGIDHVT